MKLNDFNNLTNFGIEDPRMTTIGGVAFRHLDRLPQVGDSVTVEGIIITVLEMDEHRIAKVRVSRGDLGEEAGHGEQPEETDVLPGQAGAADRETTRDAGQVSGGDEADMSDGDVNPEGDLPPAPGGTATGIPAAGDKEPVRKLVH